MDLLERYLTAIRWNLPRAANADDVIAELRDVIASRIEDREEALDRPLRPAEISALLRDFGHPLVVAARYGTQQWLIGPDLFPFYLFSLKVVLAICAVILVAAGVIGAAFSGHPMRAVTHGFGGMLWSLLGNAGLVTLIFAVIERTGWLTSHLQRWSPEQLPDLSDFGIKPKRGWEAAFATVGGLAFVLWWIGLIPIPFVYTNQKGLTLTPDPVWLSVWWPILALMVAQLIFSLIQWLRPRWKAARALLSIATAAAGIALLATLYQAGHWVTATSTTLGPDRLASLDQSVNLAIHYALIVTGLAWAFQCLQELWRLRKAR
jgi:hypothetical protein